ncbi:hypothetical protein ACFYSC_12700 [Streptosporangium sp. NPDC004379]|uniref:hypothetical protein n=1 Tax=Streptosporangium sp. NPDC004379 TaxID=3366189 RepID=UPI00369465F0
MALLLGVLTACASESQSGAQSCLDLAKKENNILRKSIEKSLPREVISIDDMNGCDSSNNGAWLSVNVNIGVSKEEIIEGFEKAGWSSNVKSLNKCGDFCSADLAKKAANRVIGISISENKAIEGGRGNVWEVIVSSLDGCWDDNGYRCDGPS